MRDTHTHTPPNPNSYEGRSQGTHEASKGSTHFVALNKTILSQTVHVVLGATQRVFLLSIHDLTYSGTVTGTSHQRVSQCVGDSGVIPLSRPVYFSVFINEETLSRKSNQG